MLYTTFTGQCVVSYPMPTTQPRYRLCYQHDVNTGNKAVPTTA